MHNVLLILSLLTQSLLYESPSYMILKFRAVSRLKFAHIMRPVTKAKTLTFSWQR